MRTGRSRVRRGGLVGEALDSVGRRRVRSTLTALGTVLGVGTFIAVLGLTSTANAQVDSTFNARDATQVSVGFSEASGRRRFPEQAEQAIEQLNGTVGAGISVDTGMEAMLAVGAEQASDTPGTPVNGVSPHYWRTVVPELVQGRLTQPGLADDRVAVIGQRIADRFGITDLRDQPLLRIDAQDFLVVGIVASAEWDEVTATSVTIPLSYVRAHLNDVTESMLVTTELGAAEVIAAQVPLAVDAFAPTTIAAQFTPRSQVVQGDVSQDLRTLFLALAVICLVVGAIGIANVSLIAVMERYHEIGLRRALGAMPQHILLQFLIESALIGLTGGLTGGVLGELAVVAVSWLQSWTPTMDPRLMLAGPPIGVAVGVLAGLYPAARAARIDPVEAFRR